MSEWNRELVMRLARDAGFYMGETRYLDGPIGNLHDLVFSAVRAGMMRASVIAGNFAEGADGESFHAAAEIEAAIHAEASKLGQQK